MASHMIAILVVNVLAWGFAYGMRWWCPRLGHEALVGYYLVLMPIGFFAWDDPELWFLAGCAAVGLLGITRSARRLTRAGA